MTNKELADLIYPNINKTVEDYEKMYPKRNLKEGAVVSRFAPSPTGFVHMGSLLTTLIERKIPDETDGVFYLRIEDTDQKRSVENGIEGALTMDNMNTTNMQTTSNDYTATRTSSTTNATGMNTSTMWVWMIVAIAAIGIVGLVWFYASQHRVN